MENRRCPWPTKTSDWGRKPIPFKTSWTMETKTIQQQVPRRSNSDIFITCPQVISAYHVRKGGWKIENNPATEESWIQNPCQPRSEHMICPPWQGINDSRGPCALTLSFVWLADVIDRDEMQWRAWFGDTNGSNIHHWKAGTEDEL